MASSLITPAGEVILVLSKAEAAGLAALAGEGAAGLLNDASAARGFIGSPAQVRAAERALAELEGASARAAKGLKS